MLAPKEGRHTLNEIRQYLYADTEELFPDNIVRYGRREN